MDRKKAERWKSGCMLTMKFTSTLSVHCKLAFLRFIFNWFAWRQSYCSTSAISHVNDNYTYKRGTQAHSQHALSSKTIIMRSNAYSLSLNHCFYFLNVWRRSGSQWRKITTHTEMLVLYQLLSWVEEFLHFWQKISKEHCK